MKKLAAVLAIVLAIVGMTAILHAQVVDTFQGVGGRCNVGLTQNNSNSVFYTCSGISVAFNGEAVPTHHIGFNVVATDRSFSNGSFVVTDSQGAIVLLASNWTGSVAYNGVYPLSTYALSGNFSGTLSDGSAFNGSASQGVTRQKVQTYRSVSYIWVVSAGTGSYAVN